MSGKEELNAVLAEIAAAANDNICGMGDDTLHALAGALRTMFRAKVPRTYSRESAARELGISVRQLQRDVQASGVHFRRNGEAKVWLTEEDIKRIREYRLS